MPTIELNKIYPGDCLQGMKTLPDNFVDCVVTSPPYFGLRDYGVAGQLGLEASPESYIEKMVEVFSEVKRVLKKDGTLWLNIGDSYAGSCKGFGDTRVDKKMQATNKGSIGVPNPYLITNNLKAKDLIGIPWMLAFALRKDGWFLRQDIIWNKKNPMPESVTDRCTKAHEYIFLLSKSSKYYYDAFSIATPYQDKTLTTFGIESKGRGDGSGLIQSENWARDVKIRKPKDWKESYLGRNPRKGVDIKGGNQASTNGIPAMAINGSGVKNHSGYFDADGNLIGNGKANKRSVWSVPTIPYADAHFATFPEELIVDCIKAGCREDGIVLDPFMGAGTTALVARKLNRNFIGIELNPDYIKIAEKRLRKELGLFH